MGVKYTYRFARVALPRISAWTSLAFTWRSPMTADHQAICDRLPEIRERVEIARQSYPKSMVVVDMDYLLDEVERLNAEVAKYRRLYDIEAHGDRSK
jgi:hypothetical protein